MTAQHTPGPWFTGIDNATGQSSRVRASHRGGRDDVCVAEIPPAKDSAEREANARLIAAAPDLFAALDAIIDGRFWSMSDNKFGAAKAALAKARGDV